MKIGENGAIHIGSDKMRIPAPPSPPKGVAAPAPPAPPAPPSAPKAVIAPIPDVPHVHTKRIAPVHRTHKEDGGIH